MDITKLEQAKQAKREFIDNNMGYDLRTPFTGVYSRAELANSITKEEKVKEYLGYVISSAKQWMEVVSNIFEIYKADAIAYQVCSFDMKVLLFEIQALYAAVTYTRGLKLFIICESYSIETQYLRLKQILISLVSNAIKFTEQWSVTVSAMVINKLLTIQVKDTGIGIPENKQGYIFEQFTKLKASNQSSLFVGSGLGLYNAKRCVEQLKGKITLSSQPGKGSTFPVGVPLKKALD